MIAAEFDDGGRRGVTGFAGIEDQRDAVAELAEDFFAGGTTGRAGKIGAGAGERDADFGDEASNDLIFRPAEGDAAGIAGHLERKTIGGVHDDGERAGPASVGEAIEIVGKFAGQNHGVVERADQDGERSGFGTALHTKDFLDGREIDGVGGEGVERVRGDGDDGTTIEPARSITDDLGVRNVGGDL